MKPPTKTPNSRFRVYHGGCWYNFEPSSVRAASRNADVPANRDDDVGFRCALPGRMKR